MPSLNCEKLTTQLFRVAGCHVESLTWYDGHSKRKHDLLGFDRLAIPPLKLDTRFPWMSGRAMWIQATSRSNISTRQNSVAERWDILFRFIEQRYLCIGWDRPARGQYRFKLVEFDLFDKIWRPLSERVVTLAELNEARHV